MRIRDYRVSDTDQVTANLLNQVTGDFSNAVVEALLELQEFKRKNTAFKAAVNGSMSYLIQRNNATNGLQTGLKVTAYNAPDSASNIQLDHVYGQLTLAETDRVTHFPTVEDNYGRFLAIPSVAVYSGATESSFAENTTARAVVDDEGEIWLQELTAGQTTAGSIWVKITTPVIGQTPNLVSVYPLAGTVVETLKIRRQGAYTEFSPNSAWPVKYHQNFSDFEREIRIKLKGVAQPSGNYVFALKKADIYSVRYATQGTFTYTTADAFTNVASVTLNNPFFYPQAAQNAGMVRLRVLTLTDVSLYDNSRSSEPFTVPAGPAKVKVEGTLYRTNGNTPFVRTIV